MTPNMKPTKEMTREELEQEFRAEIETASPEVLDIIIMGLFEVKETGHFDKTIKAIAKYTGTTEEAIRNDLIAADCHI